MSFFSFVHLDDPGQHRVYNEWHQLDHRPENLALPGVAWGERWGRTGPIPEDAGRFSGLDYMAMYWFRAPVKESIAEWTQLGADSFQWGRGPLIPGVRRSLTAFFRPVKGYAALTRWSLPTSSPTAPTVGCTLH